MAVEIETKLGQQQLNRFTYIRFYHRFRSPVVMPQTLSWPSKFKLLVKCHWRGLCGKRSHPSDEFGVQIEMSNSRTYSHEQNI